MSHQSTGRRVGKRVTWAAAVAAGVAVSVFLAAAAGAEPADGVPSVVVRYSTSMLSTDSGVRQLYRRLNLAAEKVCVEHSVGPLVSQAILDCRRDAVARAVQKIDNAKLLALQASRTKIG